MKRIVMLTALAAMMAAAMALSGVAQARPVSDSADAQCLKLAIRTLGPGFNPSDYTFFGGTEGGGAADLQRTTGSDVYCGFGGDDVVGSLNPDDIFLGGAGADTIGSLNEGTFYGGAGDDSVLTNIGTFDGGDGTDSVGVNLPGGTIINVEQVG